MSRALGTNGNINHKPIDLPDSPRHNEWLHPDPFLWAAQHLNIVPRGGKREEGQRGCPFFLGFHFQFLFWPILNSAYNLVRKRSTSTPYKALMCVFGQKATRREGVGIKALAPAPTPTPLRVSTPAGQKPPGSSSIALNKWMNSSLRFLLDALRVEIASEEECETCAGKTHVKWKALDAAHTSKGDCACKRGKGVRSLRAAQHCVWLTIRRNPARPSNAAQLCD